VTTERKKSHKVPNPVYCAGFGGAFLLGGKIGRKIKHALKQLKLENFLKGSIKKLKKKKKKLSL